MGYALAQAARDQGAQVTLISTTGQPAPFGATLVAVETAAEMRDAVLDALAGADALLMAAAVADYQPATAAAHKIKKGEGGLVLDLIRTPDILAEVASRREPAQVIVGFAAETEDLMENALGKLRRKRLDLIVANDARLAMGAATNQVTLIGANGRVEALPLLPKADVARLVIDQVASLIAQKKV
jgi:phosphopantothenoylcysteine decarboxylase/phosphopantothenate--cysteine ligase